MGAKRGAYRHRGTETTGDARRDRLKEQTGLTTKQWAAMNRALDAALGIGAAAPRRKGPTVVRAHFVRWRITYSGPSLKLALLARAARGAIERALTAGTITKPSAEGWRDPWEDFE